MQHVQQTPVHEQDTAAGIILTLLGTGTSTGVPVIGCDCEVCTSGDPRDRRLRCSVLVETQGRTLLIDTSPDLREQMLLTGTRQIDGILFTHAHADHTSGLDELRRFNVIQDARIPVWATPHTAEDLQRRFDYAFDHSFSYFGGKPDLDLHTFEPGASFMVHGIPVQSIPVMHGTLPIVGFRLGDVAYVTDVKSVPDASWSMLRDLDVLVLTALRQQPHGAHLSLREALEIVEMLGPRQAILTHVAHEMGRAANVASLLPAHVQLGHDGMQIRL